MSRLESLQSKKGFLDKLYFKIGKQKYNFWVCGTFIDDKRNKKFTKWKKYLDCVANIDVLNLENNDWKDLKFFEGIDNKQILRNEIVLDIEDPNEIKSVMEKLKRYDWNYSVWKTGSKGYHIHIFLDKEATTHQKEAFVKLFDADIQKCSEKNLIALENEKHWRTGNMKEEIDYEQS